LAGILGGFAETAGECAMAGECTPGDFAAGGLTGGATSVSSQPKQYPEGTLIDTRTGKKVTLDVSEVEYITGTPYDVHLPGDHTEGFGPKEYKTSWQNFAGWLMHAVGGIFGSLPDKKSKNIQETEWSTELMANLSLPPTTTGEV